MKQRNKIITIACGALSLLNIIVGGVMGFLFVKGEDRGIFTFMFFVFVVAAATGVVCDWITLQQANREMEYRVLKLRKGRFVREPRRMERDTDGLRALQMGITGWLFSFTIVLFAFALVWPDTFWLFSFRVMAGILSAGTVLVEFVVEIIIAIRKEKKSEK